GGTRGNPRGRALRYLRDAFSDLSAQEKERGRILTARALVSLNDVGFAYGPHPALSHITLDVEEGEFLGIVGPNSGGKSTVLRVMSRAVSSWSGEVKLMDRPLQSWDLKELARTVARVSSEDYFAFPFTVEQIVLMGRTPYLSRWGMESARDHAVAEE